MDRLFKGMTTVDLGPWVYFNGPSPPNIGAFDLPNNVTPGLLSIGLWNSDVDLTCLSTGKWARAECKVLGMRISISVV